MGEASRLAGIKESPAWENEDPGRTARGPCTAETTEEPVTVPEITWPAAAYPGRPGERRKIAKARALRRMVMRRRGIDILLYSLTKV
jgi:hypothetical protein